MSLLRKIFGGNPVVTFLTFDHDDHSILLASETPLKLGMQQVVAEIAGQKLNCKVHLESLEAATYYGKFLGPAEAIEHLKILLPQPKKFTENRGAQRFERVLRVVSQTLPGYQVVCVDLSVTGMKLRVPQMVAPGLDFECELEFDDVHALKLRLHCVVRWCRPVGQTIHAGVEFLEVSKGTQSRLVHFVTALSQMEQGVLSEDYLSRLGGRL